jgi:Polysaccharide deacetylase
MMKPFLMTFDVEEFDLPSELGRPLPPRLQVQVAERGVRRILPLLAAHGVRATFFITGRFARLRPEVVREIVAAGHEAAVHGLLHRDDYATMEPECARRRLARARERIESLAGRSVRGARMPRLRACPPAVLREAGFGYDATPHPTWIPGRYSGLHWPRSPWMESGVMRVPISVLPGLRLPVSWLSYRLAGPRLGGWSVRLAEVGAPYLHLYFHTWETEPVGELGVPSWLAARTGNSFLRSLDRLLAWGAAQRRPMSVGDYVAAMG